LLSSRRGHHLSRPLSSLLTTRLLHSSLFLFHYTTTPAIYTLSLHDALPIYQAAPPARIAVAASQRSRFGVVFIAYLRSSAVRLGDRKSTRLNSSHSQISYAVFCLKKKKDTIDLYNGFNEDDRRHRLYYDANL